MIFKGHISTNNNRILLHQLSCGGTGNVLLHNNTCHWKSCAQVQRIVGNIYHCLGSIAFTSESTVSQVDGMLDKPVLALGIDFAGHCHIGGIRNVLLHSRHSDFDLPSAHPAILHAQCQIWSTSSCWSCDMGVGTRLHLVKCITSTFVWCLSYHTCAGSHSWVSKATSAPTKNRVLLHQLSCGGTGNVLLHNNT